MDPNVHHSRSDENLDLSVFVADLGREECGKRHVCDYCVPGAIHFGLGIPFLGDLSAVEESLDHRGGGNLFLKEAGGGDCYRAGR